MSYNINGLSNKSLYPEFFSFISQHDIFALSETHIVEDKVTLHEKFFKDFSLFWKPAIKTKKCGRASGGYLFGVKKSLVKEQISCCFQQVSGMDTIVIRINGMKIILIPVYINGATWNSDSEDIDQYFLANYEENIILIGDMNARIGEVQQSIDEIISSTFEADLGQRSSEDKILNPRGSKILGLCNN